MPFYRGLGDVDAGTESGRVLRSQNNLSDVNDVATARTNLGLGGVVGASNIGYAPTGTIGATNVQDAIDEVVSDLSASSGSSVVGFIQSGASAVARTLQDKGRESVSIQDFGGIGDGASHPLSTRYASLAAAQVDYPHATALTDEIDWAATYAALSYCLANNRAVSVEGEFLLNNAIVLSGEFPISMIGKGVGVSRFVYKTTNATIQLTSTDQEAGSGWFIFGIAFVTGIAGVATGLKLTSQVSTAKAPATSIISCYFGWDSFNSVSGANKYFDIALHLDTTRDSFLSNNTFFGHAGVGTARANIAIYLTGEYTAGPKIVNSRFFQFGKAITKNTGALTGEQLDIVQCNFVTCNYGIYLDSSANGGDPGLFVSHSHLNCEFGAIYANRFNQVLIGDNLIYGANSATYKDIELVSVTSAVIHDNQFTGASDPPIGTCAVFTSVEGGKFDNNLFQRASRNIALQIDSGCSKISWSNNAWDEIPTPVSNALTDKTKFTGRSNLAPGYAQIGKATQSILNNTDTILDWASGQLVSTVDTATVFNAGTPSRLTVPRDVTRVIVGCNLTFAANATGYRYVTLLKNGAAFFGMADTRVNASATLSTQINIVSGIVEVVAGDYFEIQVRQNSGGALDVIAGNQTRFTMEFVS